MVFSGVVNYSFLLHINVFRILKPSVMKHVQLVRLSGKFGQEMKKKNGKRCGNLALMTSLRISYFLSLE